MTTRIHPTAVVDPKAQIGAGAQVGAYAVIGQHVRIGQGTRIHGHVTIDGRTTIGARCEIFPYASLGAPAQIRKEPPTRSYLEIGDDNVIREYVTMNPSMREEGKTTIGHRNFFMTGAHVAHDCTLGNDITIANLTALAGHVLIEDKAVLGGLCGVHQFVRIGRSAMLGGLTKAVQDVLPFSMVDGRPARFCGLNSVGLQRAGFSSQDCAAIKKALRTLCSVKLPLNGSIEKARFEGGGLEPVEHLLRFASGSKRGFCRSGSQVDAEPESALAG